MLPGKLRPPQWSTKTAEMMDKVDIYDQMYNINQIYISDEMYIFRSDLPCLHLWSSMLL